MQYTTLGRTGLVVSRLTLGTANFGTDIDQEQATALVSEALTAGINFFDTSNVYGTGLSEGILAHTLGARRKDVIVATKIGRRTSDALIDAGLSYRNVIASTEASLKRLGTDYIDLLQLHVTDPITPFEETARALDNLVQRGLVRYIGYSNFTAWQASQCLALQQQQKYAQFVSGQMYYSLLGRGIEQEIVPFSQHANLGLLTYSPLAGGFLSGKYTRENPDGNSDGRNGRLASLNFDYLSALSSDRETGYIVVEKLREIATQREATPAQIALAWILSKPFVTSVIVGASSLRQFSHNVAAENLQLTPEEKAILDQLTALKQLYPYVMPTAGRDRLLEQALN